MVTGQAAGLFSFIEYQVLKLGAVNLGFLPWLPQASELHPEMGNVFRMRLLQSRGTRSSLLLFITAIRKHQPARGKQGWGASTGEGSTGFRGEPAWLDDMVFSFKFPRTIQLLSGLSVGWVDWSPDPTGPWCPKWCCSCQNHSFGAEFLCAWCRGHGSWNKYNGL